MSSKGYKYHEDEINSGRSEKISTRVPHQLGQDLEKIIRAVHRFPTSMEFILMETYRQENACCIWEWGAVCCKNGQVIRGGQGPREDGGRWALNYEM